MIFSKPISFPNYVKIGEDSFEVIYSFEKRKSSQMKIENSKILFKTSIWISKKNQLKHFESLLEKIKKRPLNNLLQKSDNFYIEKIFERGYFKFNGINFQIEPTKKKGLIFDPKSNTIFLNLLLDFEIKKKLLIKFLIKHFQDFIEEYTYALNKKTYNYRYNSIKLSYSKSKWGHCTSKDDIMINLKLLNTKREILDYVLIHELSHIKHKNHSKNFWSNVYTYCRNYKKHILFLKENYVGLF